MLGASGNKTIIEKWAKELQGVITRISSGSIVLKPHVPTFIFLICHEVCQYLLLDCGFNSLVKDRAYNFQLLTGLSYINFSYMQWWLFEYCWFGVENFGHWWIHPHGIRPDLWSKMSLKNSIPFFWCIDRSNCSTLFIYCHLVGKVLEQFEYCMISVAKF